MGLMGWSKRQQRNARIIMQRTENKQQGRPTYANTGKKKTKRGCPGLTVLAAGLVANASTYIEAARWLS